MQAKALADRYTKLKGQMDSIIREANEEMSTLRENLNSEDKQKVAAGLVLMFS